MLWHLGRVQQRIRPAIDVSATYLLFRKQGNSLQRLCPERMGIVGQPFRMADIWRFGRLLQFLHISSWRKGANEEVQGLLAVLAC